MAASRHQMGKFATASTKKVYCILFFVVVVARASAPTVAVSHTSRRRRWHRHRRCRRHQDKHTVGRVKTKLNLKVASCLLSDYYLGNIKSCIRLQFSDRIIILLRALYLLSTVDGIERCEPPVAHPPARHRTPGLVALPVFCDVRLTFIDLHVCL